MSPRTAMDSTASVRWSFSLIFMREEIGRVDGYFWPVGWESVR